MTKILPLEPTEKNSYNAVKIQINMPQASHPENIKNDDKNYEMNAVSIVVNKPEVNPNNKRGIYSYPEAASVVTYEQAGISPVRMPEVPVLPVAYQTNLINNKTLITAEFDVKDKNNKPAYIQKTVKKIETIEVPEPNFTTTEAEKAADSNITKDVSFNGLTFKAAPEVILSQKANIEPLVDIDSAIYELKSADFDKQAIQIDKIASVVLDKNKQTEALPYLTAVVFSTLSEIVSKDTSSLAKPDDEQIEARKKIIIDELIREKKLKENPKLKKEDIDTGITITKEDIAIASKLSPFEMAERNKEYAMYTLAGLIILYTEEFTKNFGETVPFTDLPGVSSIINTFKSSENPSLKIAAINSLSIIMKPEYAQEIISIFKVVTKDQDRAVAQYATMALNALEKQN